jgi:TonB family protein
LIEAGKQSEDRVIDNFRLRQYLGGSENSTVFLMDHENGQKAAIKFLPVEGNEATKQLSYWKRAAQLSHPHLLKIFEGGRCQMGGRDQVYLVTEYAEENLSEILPQRALTAAEVGEMLRPLLDCLEYLHGNGFVHGRLRPGNIMALNDQLKISSDSLRQVGEAFATSKKRSRYDSPEAGTAPLSANADVWSLGITLVEVLTQQVPDWETTAGEPVVPSSLPEPFREVARNCLNRDPNARWTVPEIKARLNGTQAPAATAAEQVTAETTHRRSLRPMAFAVMVILAIVVATAALFRWRSGNPSSATRQPPLPKTEQMAELSTKPAAGPPPETSAAAMASTIPSAIQGDVIRQVPPNIPPSAQRTIRGTIKLTVRVHVDRSGNVTRTDLVSAGPSQYFARRVLEAAQQWKFVPSNQPSERMWMLRFNLTREGTSAHPQPTT